MHFVHEYENYKLNERIVCTLLPYKSIIMGRERKRKGGGGMDLLTACVCAWGGRGEGKGRGGGRRERRGGGGGWRKVVRFVWYLQDCPRVPRGSRQVLTGKCCSYLFPVCVVFAGLVHGAKEIPANFDPQMLFLSSAVLCGICRTFAGRQGDPGKF